MSSGNGPQPWPLDNCPSDPVPLKMPGYDHCILGIVERCGQLPFILYDPEKVLKELMLANAWDHEAAAEWLDYNMAGAWFGESSPGFLAPFVESDYDE